MVGVAAYFDALATQLVADAAEIGVQFRFHRRLDERLPVFRAEH